MTLSTINVCMYFLVFSPLFLPNFLNKNIPVEIPNHVRFI